MASTTSTARRMTSASTYEQAAALLFLTFPKPRPEYRACLLQSPVEKCCSNCPSPTCSLQRPMRSRLILASDFCTSSSQPALPVVDLCLSPVSEFRIAPLPAVAPSTKTCRRHLLRRRPFGEFARPVTWPSGPRFLQLTASSAKFLCTIQKRRLRALPHFSSTPHSPPKRRLCGPRAPRHVMTAVWTPRFRNCAAWSLEIASDCCPSFMMLAFWGEGIVGRRRSRAGRVRFV